MKVQVPHDTTTSAPQRDENAVAMFYDESRSFYQQYFYPTRLGATGVRVYQLLEEAGLGGFKPGTPKGMKGFLFARREGTSIRLFVDRCAPVPSPMW